MPRRAICLSGLFGSEMHTIARQVAERLGFALVDEEIVLRAAAGAEVEPRVVARIENPRSFMERAMEAFGSSAEALSFVSGTAPGPLSSAPPVSDELRELIRSAIEETAEEGNVVIVSHAASHALAERPDVLRVLVIASPATRRARVGSRGGLTDTEADDALAKSDAARAEYFRRFYSVKSELPSHYDLVVNTDRLSPDEATSLVVGAAGHESSAPAR